MRFFMLHLHSLHIIFTMNILSSCFFLRLEVIRWWKLGSGVIDASSVPISSLNKKYTVFLVLYCTYVTYRFKVTNDFYNGAHFQNTVSFGTISHIQLVA